MKRIYSICLIVLFFLFQVTPAFASVATSSNWIPDAGTASSSDWNFFTPFDWDSYYQEFGVAPFAVSTVVNTVDFTGSFVYLNYYDMSNNIKSVSVRCNPDGTFPAIARPSDYVKPYRFYLGLNSYSSIPPSGTYSMSVHFGSFTGQTYTQGFMNSVKPIANATSDVSSKIITSGFEQFSGDFTFSSVVDIGTKFNGLVLGAYFDQTKTSIFPIGGQWYVNFTRSSSSPDYTTAGGPQSSEDIQQDISNSAGQIANNTEAINGTLKELIQHISNQLAALWDQMYNYMHVPLVNNDNARTQRIIDRLDEGFDINVDVLDRNFHDLMDNDDKNTNQVTNGYDNGSFNSANNQLQASIDTYDKAETDIFDSVKGNITGFQIPDFTSNVQVLSAVSFGSSYLQRLFIAIGLFNLPVTVSLVLVFVLMILGYYRVRS